MNQRLILIEQYIYSMREKIESIIENYKLSKYENIPSEETEEEKKKRIRSVNRKIKKYNRYIDIINNIEKTIDKDLNISELYRNLNTAVSVLRSLYPMVDENNKPLEDNYDIKPINTTLKSIFHKSIDPIRTDKLNELITEYDNISKSLYPIYKETFNMNNEIKTFKESSDEISDFIMNDTIKKTLSYNLSLKIQERINKYKPPLSNKYSELINEYKKYYRNIDNTIYDYEKTLSKITNIEKKREGITIVNEFLTKLPAEEIKRMNRFKKYLDYLDTLEEKKINQLEQKLINLGIESTKEKVYKKHNEERKQKIINNLANYYYLLSKTNDYLKLEEIQKRIDEVININKLTQEEINKAIERSKKINKDSPIEEEKEVEKTVLENKKIKEKQYVQQYIAKKITSSSESLSKMNEEEKKKIYKEWNKEASNKIKLNINKNEDLSSLEIAIKERIAKDKELKKDEEKIINFFKTSINMTIEERALRFLQLEGQFPTVTPNNLITQPLFVKQSIQSEIEKEEPIIRIIEDEIKNNKKIA